MNDLVTPAPIAATPAPAWRKPAMLGGAAVALVAVGALAGALIGRPQASAPEAAANNTAGNTSATTAAAPMPAPVHSASRHAANGGTSAARNGNQGSSTTPLDTQPAVAAPVCGTCGVVESVETVVHKGEGTGLGAVAGGVLGGVIGNQMGSGKGRSAMTVIGAVGGGLAGNEIEKRQRSTTSYRVKVRMDDGSLRTVERSQSIAAGTRVTVDGQKLSVRQDNTGAAPSQGRMLQTGSQQS